MPAAARHIVYAQSGGVTAVINATAGAVINAAATAAVRSKTMQRSPRVYVGKNGILGVLEEDLYETWHESKTAIAALAHTPGGAFGSCRIKLPNPQHDLAPYRRLQQVFAAHNIGYFLYNGGNDSADTTLKISAAMKTLGTDITSIGIPKTIDNDLPTTDCCPGFGSVAKYIAVSVMETMRDIQAMCRTSTKVFILEVMGRHAGWIAAAAGLASRPKGPVVILFPEVPFNPPAFLNAVATAVHAHGYAVVVVSEGLRNQRGDFIVSAGTTDNFAHQQLGGVAPHIAHLIGAELKYKCHWGVADYLQRSARHIASAVDLAQAQAVGAAAVALALRKEDAMMPVIWRLSDAPYQWDIGSTPLARIANRERKMPSGFISRDKYFISAAGYRYLSPLIAGECPPPFKNGLPQFAQLKNRLCTKKLPAYTHPA